MNKLVLAISGQVVRENSANLMNFWRGLINIQNAIHNIDELKIVAHSWNPEFDNLVKNVYNVDILESEKQNSFVKEYMPLINPVDKFEHELKRYKSTWSRVSPQTILGNATSRSKVIECMASIDINEDTMILAVRWDQGCTGSKSVNSIIYDNSLPKEYLYISYYSEIDEGYADMWFLAPYSIAINFKEFKNYILDSFDDKNNYFNHFTKDGWPLAITKKSITRLEYYSKKVLDKINFKFITKLLPEFIGTKVYRLERKMKYIFNKPFVTGENSLLNTYTTNVKFPSYQALNIHAILKYFIIDKGLREKTRFLDIKDFENLPKGQMINPIPFAYVIYTHSSFNDCWDMAIGQAKECLPSNCKKIYLISDDSKENDEYFSKLKHYDIELIKYNNDEKYTNRIINAFSKINETFDLIYFVHEDMPLTSFVDKIYLNTLLHFMKNSNEYYIKLVDTNLVDSKIDHDSFPELVKNIGGYSFSIQPSLMKVDFMIAFLKNFNEDIWGVERVAINSNFSFSAVKGNRKVGKYLFSNNYFPHVATAISKGKWVTSEWKDEIQYLAKKYGINLEIRGEH
jgi:hypothetical protein